jgi:diguanylate cyclase (GGDEF)-like protein
MLHQRREPADLMQVHETGKLPRGEVVVASALAVLIAASFVLAGMAVIRSSRAAMTDQVESAVRAAATDRAQSVSELLETSEGRFRATAAQPLLVERVKLGDRAFLTGAVNQTMRLPGVVGTTIYGSDGTVLGSAGQRIPEVGDGPSIFQPTDDRHVGHVIFRTSLQDEAGTLLARGYQELDIGALLPHLLGTPAYADGTVSLVESNGDVVMSSSTVVASRVTAPALLDLVREGKVASTSYHDPATHSGRISAVAPVAGTDLVLVVGADASTATRPATRLGWRLLTILLTFLFVTAAGVTAIARAVLQARRRLVAVGEEAQRLADTDPLTGLGNRRTFERSLTSRSGRGELTGLVLVDMDGLKTLNDTHGHAAGDEGLRRVARALRSGLRPGDELARIGGDEFAAILPETTEAAARAVAQRMRAAVDDLSTDGLVRLSVSVGVSAGSEVDRLVEEADTDLYAAKRVRSL